MSSSPTVQFTIENQDITAAPADVVVLKYARKFYGADMAVKKELVRAGVPEDRMTPEDGEHTLLKTNGGIQAPLALYVGTLRIGAFQYDSIRDFATRSLAILRGEAPQIRRVAMTLHGIGAGLDEAECAQAQLRGILQAIQSGLIPPGLEKITIYENNPKRTIRIQERLSKFLQPAGFKTQLSGSREWGIEIQKPGATTAASSNTAPARPATPAPEIAEEPAEKPHAFVAMPFRKELDDIYYYGIQNSVHKSGLLCERVDHTAFMGDVLQHIKTRIETANIVIAELTDASPNVYLEVGYAWGRNIPTILLTRKSESLEFDVRNQRCLVYENIQDLEEILVRELNQLNLTGSP